MRRRSSRFGNVELQTVNAPWSPSGGMRVSARALRRPRSATPSRGGLTRRIVFASGVVVLLAIGAYALLFSVIIDLHDSAAVANHAKAILASANRLERLVTDLETDVRGFIITGDKRLLAPLDDAQDDAIAGRPLPGAAHRRERPRPGRAQRPDRRRHRGLRTRLLGAAG